MNTCETAFLARVSSGDYIVDVEAGTVYSNIRKRLIGRKMNTGYLSLPIFRRNYVLTHRVVWLLAVGDIPETHCINHKNGVKTDNRLANLECIPAGENSRHAWRELREKLNYRRKDSVGERNPRAILNREKVAEMRKLRATGKYRLVDLSGMFGVSISQVAQIVNGHQWK